MSRLVEAIMPLLSRVGITPDKLKNESGEWLPQEELEALVLPEIGKAINKARVDILAEAKRTTLKEKENWLKTEFKVSEDLPDFESLTKHIFAKEREKALSEGGASLEDLDLDTAVVKSKKLAGQLAKKMAENTTDLVGQVKDWESRYNTFVKQKETEEKEKTVYEIATNQFLAENPSGLPTDPQKKSDQLGVYIRSKMPPINRIKVVENDGVKDLVETDENGEVIMDKTSYTDKRVLSILKSGWWGSFNTAPNVGGAPPPNGSSGNVGSSGLSPNTLTALKAYYAGETTMNDLMPILKTLKGAEKEAAAKYMQQKAEQKAKG